MTTNDLSEISLTKLVRWTGNVRRTAVETGIDELAASIAAHGLINPLTVCSAPKGKFAVVAGQRRLLALKTLAKNGAIPKTHPVACAIHNDDADWAELSLAENVVRVAMHPTEQALRDIEESAEWKALGRAQFKERRQFDARETSLLGQIANAVRLHRAASGKRKGLSGLFGLIVSASERRKRLDQHQDSGKQELRRRQGQTRAHRATTLRMARNVELASLSQNFDAKRRDLQPCLCAVSNRFGNLGGKADWKIIHNVTKRSNHGRCDLFQDRFDDDLIQSA